MLEYKYMNSQNMAAFSKQVREARRKMNLTQADVAEKAGMTVNYFAMIERGEMNPSYEKLKSIARVLKLKITIS